MPVIDFNISTKVSNGLYKRVKSIRKEIQADPFECYKVLYEMFSDILSAGDGSTYWDSEEVYSIIDTLAFALEKKDVSLIESSVIPALAFKGVLACYHERLDIQDTSGLTPDDNGFGTVALLEVSKHKAVGIVGGDDLSYSDVVLGFFTSGKVSIQEELKETLNFNNMLNDAIKVQKFNSQNDYDNIISFVDLLTSKGKLIIILN